MLRLSESQTKKLLAVPETGMGYQAVRLPTKQTERRGLSS